MVEKKIEWDCDDEILIKAMMLKNDETNNKNEQGFDRVENKRQRLIKFPIISKIEMNKST